MTDETPPAGNVGIFCINIAGDVERRASMQSQFAPLGLPLTFVEAVEGSDICGDLDAYGVNTGRFSLFCGRPPLKNEIACILSHKKALARFLEGPCDYALVLEDDAVITGDIKAFLSNLAAIDEGYWEILRLYSKRQGKARVVRSFADFNITLSLKYSHGAVANCYTRLGAQKVIECFSKIYSPYDVQLGQAWENGIGMFNVEPALFRHSGTPSRIDLKKARGRKTESPRTATTLCSDLAWRLRGSLLKRIRFYTQIVKVRRIAHKARGSVPISISATHGNRK